MSQKNTPNPKTLGRTSGSLNTPIAAFTMAVLLCSYCFSSIRTARREAQESLEAPSSQQRLSQREKKDSSWIQEALDESRAEKGDKRGRLTR
ncbi:uncharacterized protein N7482_002213 [Penicillium canariense]|uniref:Transmembrane protein n=1 Tax=Penicillium canariense TaxID=189055 RepID=A0A9W9ILA3_9EURO|nr:uncharacterized protein N7482_002213 [Penicillium canariense]KAJ5176336.1 hypothetical protein N7482_002213 [Penicillium canariense]